MRAVDLWLLLPTSGPVLFSGILSGGKSAFGSNGSRHRGVAADLHYLNTLVCEVALHSVSTVTEQLPWLKRGIEKLVAQHAMSSMTRGVRRRMHYARRDCVTREA